LNHAKKTREYFKITKIVIDKSFEKFEKFPNIKFSVNISADDIVNEAICGYILKKLEKFPYPANVTFELLESEEITNFKKVKDFIHKVRDLGASIAIDDFGSGYSNFVYIDIKPDYIKIDGSIIKNINTHKANELIVEGIVRLAKGIGIKTVAEFVDSDEVLQKCINLGVDMFQGYYLGKPDIQLVEEKRC
jgi:EAL domain-containing protein (putative c-di-GMP-specific phosphodiesterase class I)